MGALHKKAVWNTVTMGHGVLCVMMAGVEWMLALYVNN